MTTHLESDSDTPALTDAVIGARVHQLMWPDKTKTQSKLAALLHVDQGAVSKRMNGKTQWRATEIALVADWLGVDVCDLLVPPAGFEPAAFCSEEPQDGIPLTAVIATPPVADVLPFPGNYDRKSSQPATKVIEAKEVSPFANVRLIRIWS